MNPAAPAIGRHVWFYGPLYEGVLDQRVPFTAVITFVWTPTLVNLQYLDHLGTARIATSVAFGELPNNPVHGATQMAGWPQYAPN